MNDPAAVNMAAMLGALDTGTFLGLPRRAGIAFPDIVVIGAPCVTPYPRVGAYCASAPTVVRQASATYSSSTHHMNFDLGGPTLPDGVVAVDDGDIAWSLDDASGNRDRLRAACAAALDAGAVPIVLGGDDSTPIPVMQAYAGHGPITIVQIDAHIDWRDEVGGERWGLSSTMRRCSEMDHVGQMILVGQRGSGSARPSDVADAIDRGVTFISAQHVARNGVAAAIAAIPEGGSTFITIDVDGLDPSLVPGVIGPEPGGLSYYDVIEIIDGAAAKSRLVGFAVVEFMPERDVNGIGALTVFRLAAHAMGRIGQQVSGDKRAAALQNNSQRTEHS